MRHPFDPDPVPSTKARAVFGLGVVALVTGPLIGGVIPGAVALALASQTRREIRAAEGFLLGGRIMRIGARLAWIGIALALGTVVGAVILGLLSLASDTGGHDFAPDVN